MEPLFLGDRAGGAFVSFCFTTSVNGFLTDFDASPTPTFAAYQRGTSTPLISGLGINQNFNGITGLHNVGVFSLGRTLIPGTSGELDFILDAGSLNGESIAGVVIAHITCQRGNALSVNETTVTSVGFGASTFPNTIGVGTVSTGSTTTSVTTSALTLSTGAVADHWADKAILFGDTTATAALAGVARTIIASTASTTPTLTVDALPVAPSSGDTFLIV